MSAEETIKCANDMATKKYTEAMLCHANPDDEELDGLIDCALNHEQLAKWLGELKELKEYKEKYRWHDLRKNPDDLPEDIKYVWVFIKGDALIGHGTILMDGEGVTVTFYTITTKVFWRGERLKSLKVRGNK